MNGSGEFVRRRLRSEEARLLHAELKTTPNILGYTVGEIRRFEHVLVAEDAGELAGVCVSKDLLFRWTDIAVLYVIPAHRGKGLGRRLYTDAWQDARSRSRHILTLSRNPEVIHLMEQFGMRISGSLAGAPLALHLHMQVHMSSLYRLRESFRKSAEIRRQGRLVCGMKRFGGA